MKSYQRSRWLLPPWRKPKELTTPSVYAIEAEGAKPPVPDAQVIEVQAKAAAIEVQPEAGPTAAPHEAAPIQLKPELPAIVEAPEYDSALPPGTVTQTALAPSSSYECWLSRALYFTAGPRRLPVERREDIENDLVPAIGAYLGDVVIRNLGGRWVPRRKLDESQLVLGDRAWLPFLRARHYMQRVQSVLDYSLTKFYRVAERHLKE